MHGFGVSGFVVFLLKLKNLNGEKAVDHLCTMRSAQKRSITIKSPHFDTRIHVCTQTETTPNAYVHKLYWATATATLADNESRTARKHAGSHVCHHRTGNLNHLGVPAKLKRPAPAPSNQSRRP